MKICGPTFFRCEGLLFLVTFVLASLFTPAYCQTTSISLLVQQTPDGGGATNPAAGVYHFEPNSEVALTATPSPGYRFVYWLGDVSNPQANSTVVHLDEPKIVVAVFDQAEQSPSASAGGFAGGGGLTTTAVNLSRAGAVNGTGAPRPKSHNVVYSLSGDSKPVIPEPATAVLLGLGTMMAFAKRRRRNINSNRV